MEWSPNVKWSGVLEELEPDGNHCILRVVVMTAEELLERYAAGERDFTRVRLGYITLNDIDLSDINLSEAVLDRTYFNRVNLRHAIMRKAKMTVGMEDVILESADLTNTYFMQSHLTNVEMKAVNLEEGSLIETTVCKVNMENANLRSTIWGETTMLDKVDLRGAIWENIIGSPLFRETTMPSGQIVTTEITLPDGSKFIP